MLQGVPDACVLFASSGEGTTSGAQEGELEKPDGLAAFGTTL